MKRFIWSLSFLVGTPLLLLLSLFLLSIVSTPNVTSPTPQVLSATTPVDNPTHPTESFQIVAADARPLIVKNYLHRYSSPLEPFAEYMVQTSDEYSLDYRLLPAIAQQESNLCKKIPDGSHNCWGFGIYGDNVIRFADYPQAISTVAKALKRDYLDHGLDTPEKIMAKYTPPSNGSWAEAVHQFLAELE